MPKVNLAGKLRKAKGDNRKNQKRDLSGAEAFIKSRRESKRANKEKEVQIILAENKGKKCKKERKRRAGGG
jgi:hypothetical protein